MKEFAIAKNDSGQRVNKFLEKAVPLLPGGMMHKYIRLKRIKVNGKRTDASYKLQEGDLLQLYINDEFFESPKSEESWKKIEKPALDVVYEDENILLANKAPGMVVHADESGSPNTLIANIQAYLYRAGEWDPASEASFAPALCNRIDRNTGGIVIAAKTAEALRILNDAIKARTMTKKYLCVVLGTPAKKQATLEHFLRRDENQKQVEVYDRPVSGAKTARMTYRVLASQNGLSLVECTLLTGRTHQIRAQMAHIGHPLLGDGKYGRNEKNRPYGEFGQLLYSYKLKFSFEEENALSYLDGREFTVRDIGFVRKYFPQYDIK